MRKNPWIQNDFAQAIFLLVTEQTPSAAHETLLDADHNRMHARLVAGLDMFIIGHELGHILLKHTGKSKVYSFSPASATSGDQSSKKQPVNVTFLDYAGNQELAADEVGLRLFVASTLNGRPDALLEAAIGAAGGDLFFAVMDLRDKYAAKLGLPPLHDGVHPPAKVRSANLDKSLASPEMAALGLQKMPDFRLLTRTALEVLAEEAEPGLTKAIEEYKRSRP